MCFCKGVCDPILMSFGETVHCSRCAEPNETRLHECLNPNVTHVSGESILEQNYDDIMLLLPLWASVTILLGSTVFFRILGYFLLCTVGNPQTLRVPCSHFKNPWSRKLPKLKSILSSKQKQEAAKPDCSVRYDILFFLLRAKT